MDISDLHKQSKFLEQRYQERHMYSTERRSYSC